ncbi:MAG TPA: glycosyltransferase family 4 protein [Gammaproteobacteria bacterium]|jgi:UDP-N-acetylmuramyl pentapeptide phosphotransferase/UDP-N-acetylglucosamine-1-phosphate transferase|nr:glycosyltransferase family 4 protein [Gammaproteobacteria bacterium]
MSLLAVAAAFLSSAVLSILLGRYRGRFALLDLPNARSLHAGAIPRAGGLAVLAGLAVGAVIAGSMPALPGAAWVTGALALVTGISFADDIWRLPALWRLAVHLAAALMLAFGGAYALPSLHLVPGWELHAPLWLLVSFSVLLTVWFTNLYNFMDGMDGLAGGMAVIGFGTFALLGWIAHAPVFAGAAALVATAAAGFLPFNFPPARLFMGDVGSGSLGFLAALFLLWAERGSLFPLWLGLMVFSPFVMDATWTVIRRALHGEKPWEAHREHFYQRLVGQGWSHRRTTLWAYVLMLKCSLFAVLAICFTAPGVQGLLLGWLALTYLSLIAYVNVIERKPVST